MVYFVAFWELEIQRNICILLFTERNDFNTKTANKKHVCLFFRKIVAEFLLPAFSKTHFRSQTVHSQLHTLYSLSIKRLLVIKGISEDVCAHWLQESWNDSEILFVSERPLKKPYSWSRCMASIFSLCSLCIHLLLFFFGRGRRVGLISIFAQL